MSAFTLSLQQVKGEREREREWMAAAIHPGPLRARSLAHSLAMVYPAGNHQREREREREKEQWRKQKQEEEEEGILDSERGGWREEVFSSPLLLLSPSLTETL